MFLNNKSRKCLSYSDLKYHEIHGLHVILTPIIAFWNQPQLVKSFQSDTNLTIYVHIHQWISLFMFIFISDLSLLALWILPRWRSPPSTLISTFQHLFLDFFYFFFGQKYKCIEGDSSLNLGSMKLLKRWINRWSANMTAHWQYPSLECNSKALDGLHSISINVSVKLSILTLI